MAIRTCPADVVRASPDRIWDLMTLPAELARWAGATLVDAPARRIAPGDRVVLGVGLRGLLKAEISVLDAAPPRMLRMDIHLPFGIVNHERVEIGSIGDGASRVTYN